MSRPPRRSGLSGGAPLLAGAGGALLTLLAAVLVFVLLSVWIYRGAGPQAPHGAAATTVVLRKGAGLTEIGADLQRAGVIRSAPLFLAAVEATRASRALRAGEYAFPSRASLAQVIGRMRSGQVVHHKVTIPEGLSSRQAVAVLMHTDVLTGDVIAPPAEGSLLPETYEVVRGESRAAVIKRMQDARDRLLAVLWAQRRPGLPYADADQAVTLASIVERETAVPAERPRVAAVYLNRLKQGMRLEADPTLIYGLTQGAGPLGHGLTEAELKQPNPYNSYLTPGLPPTPIDNPGRASLAAVMDPPSTDELYFVADGSGGHAFSATLAEHNRNVARWRALEAQRAEAVRLAGPPIPPPLEHR